MPASILLPSPRSQWILPLLSIRYAPACCLPETASFLTSPSAPNFASSCLELSSQSPPNACPLRPHSLTSPPFSPVSPFAMVGPEPSPILVGSPNFPPIVVPVGVVFFPSGDLSTPLPAWVPNSLSFLSNSCSGIGISGLLSLSLSGTPGSGVCGRRPSVSVMPPTPAGVVAAGSPVRSFWTSEGAKACGFVSATAPRTAVRPLAPTALRLIAPVICDSALWILSATPCVAENHLSALSLSSLAAAATVCLFLAACSSLMPSGAV
ncbi:Uncharacterised protein [Mycobacteroides abscessus subsp. abscessus]|nr:Uncharacterised protein [Mycobacteroides abscessus subsp. abscessus]